MLDKQRSLQLHYIQRSQGKIITLAINFICMKSTVRQSPSTHYVYSEISDTIKMDKYDDLAKTLASGEYHWTISWACG